MTGTWARSGVLSGAVQLIVELGQDPVAVCRHAGLDPAALSDPELPVSPTGIVSFLAQAAEVCACETFGLRLASRQDLSVLGPLWLLMRSAATVGQLVADLARYYVLRTRAALIDAHPEPGGLIVSYSMANGLPAEDRQTIEFGIALFCNELHSHAPPGWQPASVQLRHAAAADLRWHRRFFGPALSFNQDRNAVFIDSALLERPLADADARSRRLLSAVFEGRQSKLPQVALARVESVVRALLPFSSCSIDEVASAVSVSSRTLQRQLAAGGATFQQLRDRVRADLALKYLRQSALQLGQISEILGYSEPSAFTRSFRRWHGCSPRAARQRLGDQAQSRSAQLTPP
ncbi:MAG: AraC family transcriptional regulator [Caldimonas sp.]